MGKSKHELALKYEWYDPNTQLAGKELQTVNNQYTVTKADVKFTALGLGYNYFYDENVKFMFYYNVVTNETTNITGFDKDLLDNIFTLRMQYKF